MLKRDVVILKHVKHTTAKADLGVHHILFNIDDRKSASAGNTGNDVLAVVFRCGGNDHCAGSGGVVCVANVDRNARITNREDRILMEHRSTHIGKLTQLAIGDGLNGQGIVNNARVSHQATRNVGPVFIEVCLCGARHNRAGNI